MPPCPILARRIERLRQPEIEHLDRAVVLNLDVGRLQVAVDDTRLMRRFQCLGNLFGDWECLIEWDGTLGNAVSERRPFNEFEHQGARVVTLLDAVNGSDVGMVQRGKNLGLALEPGRLDLTEAELMARVLPDDPGRPE